MCDGAVVVGKRFAQRFQFLRHRLAVFHGRCAVDTLAHLLYLVLQPVRLLIGKADGQGLLLVDRLNHGLRQFNGTLATFQEGFVHGKAHLQVLTVLAHDLYLLLQIRIVAVERHYHRLSEALHIADVAVQVLQALGQSLGVRFLDVIQIHAAVHLQTLGGGYDDHQSRQQSCLAALDVEELLCAEVCTETSLRHHIVAVAHSHLRRHHARTAVGDVGKRSAVDEGRCVLRRLHEVRVEGIPEQYGDGSGHAEVFHLKQLAVGGDA